MNNPWGAHLNILIALVVASLIAWAAGGVQAALIVAATVLAALLLHHLRHIALLDRWLRDPDPEKVPPGSGRWDGIFGEVYRMLRRQRQSESQLTASLEDFQQAGAAMPDGLVILNADDRIEWCNPMAEQHFGLDRARDVGQSITYMVRQPQFIEYLQRENYSEPLILRQSRAGEYVLSVQLVPYGNRQTLVISRDVTDLERVETMRRDFIANVSHELRTPLTVLCGFLETISDSGSADGELLRRSLPLMMEQARRMQRLVENLLTLSRLESSHNPPREEEIDVPELARALYDDALALSAGRHRVLLDVATGDRLLGAEEELRSAFGNLISNAVRYTPERGEVEISWRRDGAEVKFSVRDSGIGIQAQHIPRLTERFYRVDRSRSRETGGTGLGLAIVKHVLTRHHGRLDITSEPGRGSTFSAVFPSERLIAGEAPRALASSA
jgi:two-component system, OmpR family, phosphate regulon sensor histidine kinase PhoR